MRVHIDGTATPTSIAVGVAMYLAGITILWPVGFFDVIAVAILAAAIPTLWGGVEVER